MKKGLYFAVPLLLCCLLLGACGVDEYGCDWILCDLHTDLKQAADTTVVNYAVEVSGVTIVDEIVYWDAAGVQVTVPGPISESWYMSNVAVTAGNDYGLTAKGMTTSGSINISYSATDTQGTLTSNDSCNQDCWWVW